MNLESSRLGKYELHAEIGRDVMGVVYRAYDPTLARPVVIRVLDPLLTEGEGFVQRFLRQAQAVARFNHPHIVTIYGIEQLDGHHCIVTEYVEGHSLSHILGERGRLPFDQALSLLRQLADDLDDAHAQGLVHGDVKPTNVIIDTQGHIKLTGFGLVPAAQETQLAAAGTTLGTPQYMSPEQASGWKVGPQADLYALGVIAYELLAGLPPFYAESASVTLYKQVHEPPPSIVPSNPSLPPEVDEVLSRVLDKEPGRRYPSGAAFVTALAQTLEGGYHLAAVAPPPVPPVVQVAQQRSAPWRWIAAAALVLAVVLAGAAVISGMIDHPNPTAPPAVAVGSTEVPTQTPAETPSDISPTGTSTSEPVSEPTDTPVPLTPANTSPPSDAPGSLVTVQIPVADVRAKPDNTSELVTQVIMGEKVMLQGKQAGWYQIAAVSQPSPKNPQGYPGWVQTDVVSLEAYEPEQVAIVMIPSAPVRTSPAADASIRYNLSIDSRVAFDSADSGWVTVTLPDGNEGWLAQEHVRLICSEGECPGGASGEADRPRPIEEILTTAMQFTGTPYLWGGASSTAFDCSGFVYRVLHANGVTISRDSRPMSQSGTWVEKSDLRPGDVVFTAKGGASGQVSHCALYIGEGQVITTYGTDPIRIVTLDDARYRDDYWGARRYP